MRAVAISALLILALPGAGAYVNVCWEIAGACAYSNAWDAGSGDCDAGAPDHYSFRTLRATWTHENTTRTVEVTNDCDAHTRDAKHWERSDLRAHYTSYDGEDREFSWIWLDWYGEDDSADGSTCATRLWIQNADPLPEGTTDPDCSVGRPPLVLLELP